MQGKPFSAINLTPMVGVLLAVSTVLLAVGWGGKEAAAVSIGIAPMCFLSPDRDPHPQLVVSLAEDGTVFIGGDKVDRARLVAELAHRRTLTGAHDLWLRADPDVRYAQVFALYREVQDGGWAGRLRIINEEFG